MHSLRITQPLYQQIYEIIRKSILTGELKPGERVNVSQLAEKYNISRTPLREALRQLQIEGLLYTDHLGLKVIKLDLKDFEELYECRIMLDTSIMKLVLKTITEEQLKKVEETLCKAEKAFKEGKYLELLDLNAEFHDLLQEASPNSRAVQLLQQVRSFLLIYRANILRSETHNKEILKEHRSIIEALKNRDEKMVLLEVERHLLNDMKRGSSMF